MGRLTGSRRRSYIPGNTSEKKAAFESCMLYFLKSCRVSSSVLSLMCIQLVQYCVESDKDTNVLIEVLIKLPIKETCGNIKKVS